MNKSTEMPKYVRVDGQAFTIGIHRCEATGLWRLEIINDSGDSVIPDQNYPSEEAALDTAMEAFREAGAAGLD